MAENNITLHDPLRPDDGSDRTHRIFFETPSRDFVTDECLDTDNKKIEYKESVTANNQGLNMQNVTVNNETKQIIPVHFTGENHTLDDGHEGVVYYGQGGTFSFNLGNLATSATLRIELAGEIEKLAARETDAQKLNPHSATQYLKNGGSSTLEVSGSRDVNASDNTIFIHWDGKDTNGIYLPLGDYQRMFDNTNDAWTDASGADGYVKATFKLFLKGGEIHFPMFNAEGLSGGITLERKTVFGAVVDHNKSKYDIYYNNSPLIYNMKNYNKAHYDVEMPVLGSNGTAGAAGNVYATGSSTNGRATAYGEGGAVVMTNTINRNSRLNAGQDHANFTSLQFIPNLANYNGAPLRERAYTGGEKDTFYYKVVVFGEDIQYNYKEYDTLDASQGVVMYAAFQMNPVEVKPAAATLTISNTVDVNFYFEGMGTAASKYYVEFRNAAGKTLNCLGAVSKTFSGKNSSGLVINADETGDAQEIEKIKMQSLVQGTNLTQKKDGKTWHGFTYSGINAYEMGDKIWAYLYHENSTDNNKVDYVGRVEFSIQDYCERMLDKNSVGEYQMTIPINWHGGADEPAPHDAAAPTDEEMDKMSLQNMLVDMLNYGAAAQTFAAGKGWDNVLAGGKVSDDADKLPNRNLVAALRERTEEYIGGPDAPTEKGQYGAQMKFEQGMSMSLSLVVPLDSETIASGSTFSIELLNVIDGHSPRTHNIDANNVEVKCINCGKAVTNTSGKDIAVDDISSLVQLTKDGNKVDKITIKNLDKIQDAIKACNKSGKMHQMMVTIKGLPPFYWGYHYELQQDENAVAAYGVYQYCVDLSTSSDAKLADLVRSMYQMGDSSYAWYANRRFVDDDSYGHVSNYGSGDHTAGEKQQSTT